MSKHDHPELKPPCAHESLKFCAKCEAVECTACGFEWKNQPAQIINMPCYRPHLNPTPYTWLTWGDNTTGGPWTNGGRITFQSVGGLTTYADDATLTTTAALAITCDHANGDNP